jgi:hypothetical protein
MSPGPALGEEMSLQVGPKLDWRLAHCFCALADTISASPPSFTPTVTPVPVADRPMVSALDGFAGPCVGCLNTVALVLAEVKRRTTAGGGLLLTRWFAFFAYGDRRPKSLTRGPRPPCQRLVHCFRRR